MGDLEQTFQINLYNKNRTWLAPLGKFESISGTKRFDNVSDFEVTVSATHPRLEQLLTPGTRLQLILRGEPFITGPIRSHVATGPGPGLGGKFTFSVEDNFRILRNFLIYQVPGASMAAQSGAFHYLDSGPAESVFKNLVTLNIANRSVEPIYVPPDLGRGPTIHSSARMATIYNEMFPLLESSGLGVSVEATPSGLTIDCYTPGTYGTKLTEASRIVRKWKYSLQAPDVTHVVVGGSGDGTARTFSSVTDTTAQTVWGDRIEQFLDAREATDSATSTQQGNDALFDGRAIASLEAELAETKNFKLGGEGGLKVGMNVTAAVAGGAVEVSDILRQIDFAWDISSGLDITAQIGRTTDPTTQMVSAISRLSSSVSKLKASK